MKNSQIGAIFEKIADILEIEGENPFRIKAYRRAAKAIQDTAKDAADLAKKDELVKLPGIGKDLASKIKEFLKTGKISTYEKLKKNVRPILLDMLSIPGIGPKTAKLLYENLKIKSLKGLEENARAHNLNGLPGVKEKTEENILKGLKFLKKNRGKMRIDTAFAAAERIISRLKKLPEVVKISPAGSLRRMKEAIRDIDILAAAKKPERVISAFVKLADTADIIAQGPAKAGILTGENIRIDLRVTSPGSYGAALMYFTGSKPHNIKMRRMASKKGLKINEYGVFRVKNGKKLAGKSEAEIYELFKMPYIEPELREDTGEIEAALYGKLPKLVKLSDIKGDFHAHTEESDGILTIDEIAGIARQKNYEYIAITNHSVSLKIAGGLSEKRVLKQVEKIRNFNKRAKGITLLAGAEVDILDNGNLDYSDNLLKKLDFVIAAIHTGFHQPKEKLTFRITKAMRNKFVNLIAHPSGRLIGQRAAYELGYEKIFKAATDTGTAIEINAYPKRLDLTDIHCRRAKELGVKLAITTDAHARPQFDNIIYGVGTARRAWLSKSDILNCMALKEIRKFVNKKRA